MIVLMIMIFKIPVLPALMDDIDSGCGSNGVSPVGSRPGSALVALAAAGQTQQQLTTLLEWVQKAGNNSLEQMADSCYRWEQL